MSTDARVRHVENLFNTWNNLRHRIAYDVVRHRPMIEVLNALDKEFHRLVRGMYLKRISVKSFKLIEFGNIDIENGYLYLRSRKGHLVKIEMKEIDTFSDWAFGEDPDKEIKMKKQLKIIGDRIYATCEKDTKDNRMF